MFKLNLAKCSLLRGIVIENAMLLWIIYIYISVCAHSSGFYARAFHKSVNAIFSSMLSHLGRIFAIKMLSVFKIQILMFMHECWIFQYWKWNWIKWKKKKCANFFLRTTLKTCVRFYEFRTFMRISQLNFSFFEKKEQFHAVWFNQALFSCESRQCIKKSSK